MRYLVLAAALALALQGCGGHGSSPTEPAGPAARGNWIGTIQGTHPGLHLQGTCTLEMQLDPQYNGQWWVDCPGAGSQGQVFTLSVSGISVMTLLTNTPRSDCPWSAIVTATASTIHGDFEVDDCTSQTVLGTGTVDLRLR